MKESTRQLIAQNKERARLLRVRYTENPTLCKNCQACIWPWPVQGGITEARKKQFCSSSCFAKYSNRTRVRTPKTTSLCPTCELRQIDVSSKLCINCHTQNRRERAENLTKGELLARFDKRGRWDIYRASLGKASRQTYLRAGKPQACLICGYTIVFHVAHIKPVAAFSNTAKIKEINNIDNLVALCPNHHYEFDNNMLALPKSGSRTKGCT